MRQSRVIFFVCFLSLVSCQRGVVDTQIRFSYKPNDIESLCNDEMENLKRSLDTVGKIPASAANFNNTVVAMESAMTAFNNRTSLAIFLKYVSTDPAVRAAADKCETEVQKFFVDIFVREDLYRAIRDATKTGPAPAGASFILLDEFLAKFKQNGLELDATTRQKFVEKKKRLVSLEAEFSKNLVEWDDSLELSAEDMSGVPEGYQNELKKTPEGKYIIKLDYPHYFPFMDNCRNENSRKQLEYKFNRRGGEKNRLLLEESIALRDELAKLLGYKTHAELVMSRRMAKKPSEVEAFLARLLKKIKPMGQSELKALLALKKEDDPKAKGIFSWDWRFYDNLLKKKKFNVDAQKMKEYFPVDAVLAGLFDTYQKILGVSFVPETEALTWHPSVKLYRVQSGEKALAYFYMDLFPREGKYNHAAAFTLFTGFEKPDGQYFAPVSAIVANFSPPTQDAPSLLLHSEVETLFHEFGHIMHQVLTRAHYGSLAGTSVKTDFVEAPSQMLENWVWDKEILRAISGHYKDHARKLPDGMIDALIGAKFANSGLKYLRQVSFAQIDLKYHTSPKVDSTDVYKKITQDTMMIPIQDGTMPQAGFGHLMGGYDAGYYGYLWSEVYAQDMFTRFETAGLLDTKTGLEYRKGILEPGGEKDPMELIKAFLGRQPNEAAFLRGIGCPSYFKLER